MTDKTLVIVESPSKAKTIGKFLGSKYKVVASVGHIRDLPKSTLGIDIENNFEPKYIPIKGKGDVIKAMRKEAKVSKRILLATDPDREGEAISWHIAFLLGIDTTTNCRIVFNEITKDAILAAVKAPRAIDKKLVDAQQARRVLDRLVGYKISPLLWRKIKRGLSAGRVQSAALKIICDREILIRNFIPKEYWNITAIFNKDNKEFQARLTEFNGKKLTVNNQIDAEKVFSAIDKDSFAVTGVVSKERIKRPYPPFTTSSLQQEASNKLGYNTKKTMMIAQQLYEGIEIKGHGTVGLVTYIRTDSVRISDEANNAAKEFITEKYSKDYLGNTTFSNKKKDVQDAHEAIRPSYLNFEPENIKDSLTKEQYNLYKIIFNRFLASRMSNAVYDGVNVDIINNKYTFKASGSRLKFDGYLKIYDNRSEEDFEKMLPLLEEGEKLSAIEIQKEQNFTKPPSQFSEAGLVKDLEEKNIGRPSTYAPIIGTLIERKYVSREKKVLIPTDLGFLVTEMMEEYFKEIVDAGFTSEMEDKLDDIEIKNLDWKEIIADFYKLLEAELLVADEKIEKIEIVDVLTDEICELCGKQMAIKHGRFGEFLACSGYPDCKNTKPIVNKIGVNCTDCGKDIIARKGKKGKLFYGCSGYPDCNKIYWYRPIDRKCPKCGELLVEKKTKASDLACSNKECDYKE
jgi:DNA topoisomerase I